MSFISGDVLYPFFRSTCFVSLLAVYIVRFFFNTEIGTNIDWEIMSSNYTGSERLSDSLSLQILVHRSHSTSPTNDNATSRQSRVRTGTRMLGIHDLRQGEARER